MAQEAGRGRMMPREDPKRISAGYRALQRITVSVRSQVDLRRMLDLLAADAGRLLDLTLCGLARWDEAEGQILFSTEYRRDPEIRPPVSLLGRRLRPGGEEASGSFETHLFREHRSFIHDGPGRGPAAGSDFLKDLEPMAYVVTPVIADLKVLGLLVAARPSELSAWSEEEIEFLRAAGDIAAVAIQHAALRSQLRVLSAAAAQINSRLSVRDLLRRLTEDSMLVTRSTMGMAGVVEGGEMVCREICRAGAWSPIDLRFSRGQGLPGWSWENRAPCIANDARSDRRALPELMEKLGVDSALTVPMVNRDGEVLGFFELHNKAAGVAYGEEDLNLAAALAHHAALALQARKA